MATVAENVIGMAELVYTIKKKFRLTETTSLRIVELNLAYAQQQNAESVFDQPDEDGPLPFPEVFGPDDAVIEGEDEEGEEDAPTPHEIITADPEDQE